VDGVSAYGYDSPRREFDRAVRQEMCQIRKDRDYPLWVKALVRVVLVAVLWGAGAIVLHVVAPEGNTLDFPAAPVEHARGDGHGR
jgi:hypothetical protein